MKILMIFKYLFLSLFLLSLQNMAQDDSQEDRWGEDSAYETGTGRSVDKTTAFNKACQNMLKEVLEKNFNRSDFERMMKSEKVAELVATSYRKYILSRPTELAWDGKQIKIKAKVNVEKLVADVKYFIDQKAMKNKMVIIKWDNTLLKVPSDYTDRVRAIVESTFQGIMATHNIRFTTMDLIQERHSQHIDESGDVAQEEDLIFQKGTASQYTILLAVQLDWLEKVDPIDNRKRYFWDCKMSAEVKIPRTAELFFKCFYPAAGENYGIVPVLGKSEIKQKAELAISNVAKQVALAILEKTRTHSDDIATNIFQAYFDKFPRAALGKIKQALDQLESEKRISDLEFSPAGSKLHARMRSRMKFSVLQEIICNECEELGVRVALDPLRISDKSQTFYFVPTSSINTIENKDSE